jgi:2-phosphosulfolactate phosphatase
MSAEHFSHKVHVLYTKEALDHERLEGKVVIVLDVLFATTTIINAFANGAKTVRPVESEDAARAVADPLNAESYVLAGELYAVTLPGFASPAPLALAKENLKEKMLIYSTTNGTVALKKSVGASAIYAGALINAQSVVEHVIALHPEQTILIVCSGSMGNPNLEDICGAGYFVDLLLERRPNSAREYFSDAALAAHALFKSEPSVDLLLKSRVGQLMLDRGMENEVQFAAGLSVTSVVPKMEGDVLVSL